MGQDTFENRVALVTGGTRGIGRAICLHLAEHGATVACVYGHDRAAAEAYRQEYLAKGYKGEVYQCDITEPDQVTAAVDQIAGTFGQIDILVNNAGITVDRTVLKMGVADWHKVLRTNLSSCFYVSHAVLPYMMKRQYGRIVNISSVSGSVRQLRPSELRRRQSGSLRFHKNVGVGDGPQRHHRECDRTGIREDRDDGQDAPRGSGEGSRPDSHAPPRRPV